MRHSLRELTLRNNDFKEFPEEVIVLVNLTSLSLAKNQLKVIYANIFPQLSQLTWLSLSNNHLQELPTDLDRCQNLLGIDISNNEFEVMPPVIHSLSQLKVLLMQKNKLYTLPEYRVFPQTLQTLNISFNNFEHLPTILIYDPPPHLTHLHLSGNPIKEIPKEFLKYEYQHLVNLDLHSCLLNELSEQFFIYLAKRRIPLCRLNLAINQLRSLPDNIGMATTLQWLNLNDNQLTFLPSTMIHLHYLAKLGLVQNQLKEIPSYLFYRMHYLEKLDLRKNQLTFLPPSILSLVPTNEIHQHIDLAVPSITFPLRHIHTHQPKSALSTPSSSTTLFNYLYNEFYDNNKEYTRMATIMDAISGEEGDQEIDSYKQCFGGSLKTLLLYENPLLERRDGIFCYKSNNQHEEKIEVEVKKEKNNQQSNTKNSNVEEDEKNDGEENHDDDDDEQLQNKSNWYQVISMEELRSLIPAQDSLSSKYPTSIHQTLKEILLSYLKKRINDDDHKVENSQQYINSFINNFPSLKDLALRQYLKKSQHDWIINHSTKRCYPKITINDQHDYHHDDNSDHTYQKLLQQQNILCRLDIQPETRIQFLSHVLPMWIPCSLRQQIIKSAKQCDNCGQWGMNLLFQIGYLTKLCNNRIQAPIRYSLCSSSCAMDSVRRILGITDHWRSKRLESALNLTEHENNNSQYNYSMNSSLQPQHYDLYHYFYKYPSIIDSFYDDTNQSEDSYRRESYSSTSRSTSTSSTSATSSSSSSSSSLLFSSHKNNNYKNNNSLHKVKNITSFINHVTNDTSTLDKNNENDNDDMYTKLNIILNQQQPNILLSTPLTSSNLHHHTLSEALFQRDHFIMKNFHPHLTSFNHIPGDAIRLERF
ncbi:unnamed protein product [Cunninghamella blakesleeana]